MPDLRFRLRPSGSPLWLLATLAAGFAGALPLYGQAADSLFFQPRQLYLDANEGAALADVNNDGRLDIIAGRNWYPAPDFMPHPLRMIDDWDGYIESNSDHAFDVNGDGWMDVIAGSFLPSEVYWYENPGAEGLAKGHLWQQHLLVDTEASSNEISFTRDLDGDGVPEWVVNSWQQDAPVLAWRLTRDDAGQPAMERFVLSETGNGHGMGFGDVNGDGREDVVLNGGWLEHPKAGAFSQSWRFHPDWDAGSASCPMLVRDLNGDGRSDLVVGQGHDFGLSWWEQLPPASDGSTQWQKHEIDEGFSQAHALHWADLNGDGNDELVTGKRKWAHNGKDPGGDEPPVLYYYTWNPEQQTFTRHTIAGGNAGTGLQIRTGDLNGDGRTDLVVPGKSGTYLLLNQARNKTP